MTHELAQELKDAGFPQDATQWVYTEIGREWPPSLILRQASYGGAIPTAAPTLSELIEACGEDVYFEKHGPICSASDEPFSGENGAFGKGLSPEEAVARLWLALNPPLK